LSEPIFEIQGDNKDKVYSVFTLSPLEQGYGHTLGTSLRRVLLSSLEGVAVTNVKISGIKHQFTTLKGVKEDVVDFILNVKKIRFLYNGVEPVKLHLQVKTPGVVKAGDIVVPANVEVANPELVLSTLSKGASLSVDLVIEKGYGYSPAEEREHGEIGLIPVDAAFSPVIKVNYRVEETRVGRLTNYDKLTLEVWTDGTIAPKEALIRASKTLVSYFEQIISPKKIVKEKDEREIDKLGPAGKLSVEEIGLPTRVANALSRAGYETVEKLVKAKSQDLMKVRNLGEKSFKIIRAALMEKGVDFSEK